MYLRFRFENKPTINGMKDKVVIRKWHNHEHRRRILAAQLELIAYMHNFELTVDQLVFHALYLFHFAYCNNELDGRPCSGNDRITPKDVMDMARVVYQMSKKDIKTLVKAELEKVSVPIWSIAQKLKNETFRCSNCWARHVTNILSTVGRNG